MKKLVVAMLAGTMLLSSGLQVSAAGLKDVFDAEYYANSYKDLKDAFGTDEEALYKHFLEYGLKEGRVMNPIIDVAAYRGKYEDLDKAFGDNWDAYIDHYFTYGVKENRDNGTEFDLKKYMAAYEDLREEFGEEDSFQFAKHYIEFGQDENRVKGDKSYEEPKPAASQEAVTAPLYPSTIYEYDANGKVIKEIYYDEDGSVSATNEYTYDENGRKSMKKSYEADGTWNHTSYYTWGADGKLETEKVVTRWGGYSVYVYGDNGKISYEEEYDDAGNLRFVTVPKYDENGKQTGYTEYYEEGRYSEFIHVQVGNTIYRPAVKHVYPDGTYSTNEVNALAQIIKSNYYDAQGNLTSYYEYKYENGLRTEEWWYNADGTLYMHVVREYDDDGNWVKDKNYRPDGSYYIASVDGKTESYINYDADGKLYYWSETYYEDDERDNPVSKKEFDENKNVIRELVPEFTEEGSIHWVEKEA